MNATDTPTQAAAEIDFLGGHVALDALNTLLRVDGVLVDRWATDADVEQWMTRHALAAGTPAGHFAGQALVGAARTLRETARELIEARKSGRRIDPRRMNDLLAHARRKVEIVVDESGAPTIASRYDQATPEQYLAPLAESVAQLICDADFSLVKQCENPDCVLCFLDRTKSHRRRWCSMALCGNRMKVAAFRRRQQEG
ncbi:CGNR zinc finger domain-containing protein [Burkholderia stagnalis]